MRESDQDREENAGRTEETSRNGATSERWESVRRSALDAIGQAGALGKRRRNRFDPGGLAQNPAVLIAAIITGLIVLVTVVYLVARTEVPSEQPPAQTQTQQPSSQEIPAAPQEGLLEQLERLAGTPAEAQDWVTSIATLVLKFGLAALLSAVIALRPRKAGPARERSNGGVQTHLVVAVIAAALMVVVAGSLIRALAVFAAASFVRFRAGSYAPKEGGTILVCLGIGLATGAAMYEVAVVLTAFVTLILWLAELKQQPAGIPGSLMLRVTTTDVSSTDQALRSVFDRHNVNAEIQQVDRQNGEGVVAYNLRLDWPVSADRLSEEIFTTDPENVESVQWRREKSAT